MNLERDGGTAPADSKVCLEVRSLIVPYLDGEATTGEARRVDEHVAACEPCARELDLERQISLALPAACSRGSRLSRDRGGPAPSAAELARRVRARVQGERRVRVWLGRVAAMLLVACGLLVWRLAPRQGTPGPGGAAEPGEEIIGALDVLQTLDEVGVEPTPEVAQLLLDELEGPYPEVLDLLLEDEISAEKL